MKVILDPAVLAMLTAPGGVVEVCDETGRTLGHFQPAIRYGKFENGRIVSPFSDEEIRIRAQQRTGQPLKEILDDLTRS